MIKEIADFLIAINKNSSNIGLFSGLSGNCIFFYELEKATQIKKYEVYGDKLIDKIFNSKEKKKINPDFGNGLAGIGWSIEYLLKHGFSDGNREEILEDIDIAVFKTFSENQKMSLSVFDGLSGYLLYVISRLDNNIQSDSYLINSELFKKIINAIDVTTPNFIQLMVRDIKFDMLWTFPVLLYSLAKSLELGVYNNKITNFINQLLFYIEAYLPGLHSHRLSLALSLFKLNSILKNPVIERQIKTLLYSIDFNILKRECDVNSLNVSVCWMGQVFLLKKASLILDTTYPNYDKLEATRKELVKTCKSPYENNITNAIKTNEKDKPRAGLIDGLAGIGLMYLFYPESLSI